MAVMWRKRAQIWENVSYYFRAAATKAFGVCCPCCHRYHVAFRDTPSPTGSQVRLNPESDGAAGGGENEGGGGGVAAANEGGGAAVNVGGGAATGFYTVPLVSPPSNSQQLSPA